jgi:hypothetical protein
MGWWLFTRSALEGLTRPRADVDACDRDVERLAHDSRLGAALHRCSRTVDAAWHSSLLRREAAAVIAELSPSAVAGWRMSGWIAVVAGGTILGLDAIKPIPVGPLSWLLPSAIVLAGLVTMMLAATLARAAADRRSRRSYR